MWLYVWDTEICEWYCVVSVCGMHASFWIDLIHCNHTLHPLYWPAPNPKPNPSVVSLSCHSRRPLQTSAIYTPKSKQWIPWLLQDCCCRIVGGILTFQSHNRSLTSNSKLTYLISLIKAARSWPARARAFGEAFKHEAKIGLRLFRCTSLPFKCFNRFSTNFSTISGKSSGKDEVQVCW